MRWQHWSFAARLLLGLLVAAVLIAALSLLTAPARPAIAPGRPGREPASAAELPRLSAGRGPVLLLGAVLDVPADAAPVVEIRAGGAVQLVRPALVRSPPALPAIVLPVADLARLSPSARGSLLECLGALLGERPARPQNLRLVGVRAAPEEILRLLSWVR